MNPRVSAFVALTDTAAQARERYASPTDAARSCSPMRLTQLAEWALS
ncbi:MAG: hypothetical protein ACRCWJ_09055 [Casimicrobium sp.]